MITVSLDYLHPVTLAYTHAEVQIFLGLLVQACYRHTISLGSGDLGKIDLVLSQVKGHTDLRAGVAEGEVLGVFGCLLTLVIHAGVACRVDGEVLAIDRLVCVN